MMTTIKDAYINALLADATYAVTTNNEKLGENLKKRLGENLATFVLANFTLFTFKTQIKKL